MSYQIGLDTLHLRPSPRLAHTDYCSNDALKRHLQASGGNIAVAGQQFSAAADTKAQRRFEDVWEMDFLWHTDDGPVPWDQRGRMTDMGHADFLEGGVDRRQPKPSPFVDPEQVLEFDAVKEYGLPDFDALVSHCQKSWRDTQDAHPNQLVTGGYYKTIVSGAIEAFGWDMLLLAAADADRFEKVLDSFFRLTMHHVRAWAKTSIPAFITHDDIVWTAGPFMSPAFYRRTIFPRYAELWSVLKNAGKKVLYCSDGDWSMFMDDIVAAGADALIFEPVIPLENVVPKYGKTHAIISSKLDCRTLTFGTKQQIQAEIDATLKLAFDCPGFMFAVGNHIPSNVPVENALFYYDYLTRHWWR